MILQEPYPQRFLTLRAVSSIPVREARQPNVDCDLSPCSLEYALADTMTAQGDCAQLIVGEAAFFAARRLLKDLPENFAVAIRACRGDVGCAWLLIGGNGLAFYSPGCDP